MTLKDEIAKYANTTFTSGWTVSDGRVVPTPESNIGLGNSATKITGTVLYADLADSTKLVREHENQFAAEIYKTYVYSAAKLIRADGGSVTAYDGDRVMGVFMGDNSWSRAVSVALKVQGVVDDILNPELERGWPSKTFAIRQKCGVAYSEIWVANTGIRGNNDYVWVGNAANDAAKMAALKQGYSTYVTGAIYDALDDNLKSLSTGLPAWRNLGSTDLGYTIWGSTARIGL